MKLISSFFILSILLLNPLMAQCTLDLGNGKYKNQLIFADYSDPDVVEAGNDFYMVASSFNAMTWISFLHSKDLVNWAIVGHVYDPLPFVKYDNVVHDELIREKSGRVVIGRQWAYLGLF